MKHVPFQRFRENNFRFIDHNSHKFWKTYIIIIYDFIWGKDEQICFLQRDPGIHVCNVCIHDFICSVLLNRFLSLGD